MFKSKIFLKFTLSSVVLFSFPFLVLSSCNSSKPETPPPIITPQEELINFMLKNKESLIVPKNESFKDFPTKIYLSNSSIINISDAFQINPKFENLQDIGLEFNYSNYIPEGNLTLAFDFKINNEYITYENEHIICSIKGFMSDDRYLGGVVEKVKSLKLIDTSLTFKEFLNTKLPDRKNLNDWNNLFDLPPILGIDLTFKDIDTGRFDFENNKLKIGTFSSEVFDLKNVKTDINLSIKDSFKNYSKPTYIFTVEGSVPPLKDASMINAEVIFINRLEGSSGNVLTLESGLNMWNKRGIYGELDFSSFDSLNIEEKQGFFNNNSITSIKFPKNGIKLNDKMFTANRINEITLTKNSIDGFFDYNSFDPSVKFKGLESFDISKYYDPVSKAFDLSKVPTLKLFYESLYLWTKSTQPLEIDVITLPSTLFKDNSNKDLVDKINALEIQATTIEFSNENIPCEISDDFTFYQFSVPKWTFRNININNNITYFNVNKIGKDKTITREINKDIRSLVDKDGTLDLNNSKVNSLVPKYKKNLNNYFQIDLDKGIIKKIITENGQPNVTINNENFDKVFENKVSKNIFIPKETGVFNWIEDKTFSFKREIPSEMEKFLIKNSIGINEYHLDLKNMAPEKFLENKKYYENLIYINIKITKITFPLNLLEIPEYAFKQVDLSHLTEMLNIENIQKIGSYAFNETQLNMNLSFPNVNEILSYAFKGNKIANIDFPELVVIYSSAFENNSLTTINLPKLKNIQSYVFNNNKLTTINLPIIEKIGASAFQNNNLTTINLPFVTVIESSAFMKNKLITIDLPNLTKIESSVFKENNLKDWRKIGIPNVTEIGGYAFWKNELTYVDVSKDIKMERTSFDINVPNKNNEYKYEKLLLEDPKVEGKWIIDFRDIDSSEFVSAINELKRKLINKPIIEISKFYLKWFEDYGNIKIYDALCFKDNGSSPVIKSEIKIGKLFLDRVISIPDKFFQLVQIEEVIGLENTKKIGSNAFNDCGISYFNLYPYPYNESAEKTGELKLNLEESGLGTSSFSNNKFSKLSFEIGSKLEIIPSNSFYNNPNLKEAIISRNIKYVSSSSFKDWSIVVREDPDLNDLNSESDPNDKIEYISQSSTLLFKVIDFSLTQKIIERINGLKIENIIFSPSVTYIPKNFLYDLKTKNPKIRVDLSYVSIINENAFYPNNVELANTGLPNIIYNDGRSGIKTPENIKKAIILN